MDSLSPQVVSAAKLPILNTNEFDLWKMRIEQYFLMTDYSLWEVILNGDSSVTTRVVEGVLQPVAPITAEQKLARKNELKARGTLLMASPDKYQLKFNSHKDAKTLMEAIEKRFGWNTETKKVQKTLLKQQYENFTSSSSESLDQIHDKLQKLVSQLDIHGVSLSQEDVNLNTTDSVSTAASVSDVCAKLPVSSLPNVDSLSNAAIYSFFASQSSSPQLDNEDLKQIDVDDLEDMDLKWQMAMLTMRARRIVPVETSTSNALVSQCDGTGSYDWSYQAKEEHANYALMAFSSSSSSSDSEVPSCSKAYSKAYAQLYTKYDKLIDYFHKSQFDVISYQKGLESVEARLLVYKQNESVLEENIKLLNIEVQLRDTTLVTLRQKLEKAVQERDDLKLKLEKFQTSTKNLTELLASQTSEKTGLGYNLKVFTQAIFDCDDYFSSESDCKTWPPSSLYDRFQPSGSHPKPDQDLSPTTRPTTPIIEDRVSDSEDEYKTKASQFIPSFVQSSEQVKTPRHSVQPIETSIPATTPTSASLKSANSGKRRNRKACFVCKSVDHLIKDCDYHTKKLAQPTLRNYAHRGNYKQYAPLTHTNPQKHMVPTAVLTQYKPVFNTAIRPVSAAMPKINVTQLRYAHPVVTKSKSPFRRHITRSPSSKTSNSPPRVTTVKALVVSAAQGIQGKWGNPQHALRDKGLIYSGCSRHMIGNMFYLSNFEELNGGYVSFGGNLKGGKISSKGNLVRGLPTKVFKNDNTCLACKKGKQHRASYKTKPVSSVNQPLFRLHMDLFGPTFVKSLNKKSYCLVVTDDYSRFTWVFFLATKDETSPILKTFITGLENQPSLKVKVIRSDNGTEFKNHDLN
uniref:Putative ribonuclease H-like domain-containing protein n=1 Tax=Tanacetum cinerariifolium TaxID=118510 RepID=A0A699IKZ7_TANCI|nr:putative ribonuclease H-like domain-containing protein [Tanacetum cinerariifolium]